MAIGFGSLSSINDSNEMLGCELLPLSRVYSIEDGALRFCHVACEEETSPNCVCPIMNRRLRFRHASIEVHQAFNLSRYNSSNKRLRLNHFKMNLCLIGVRCVPPH